MIEIIKYLSLLTVGGLTIGYVIIYISKKIIDKALDIGLEKYKGELNKDLETHKSKLKEQSDEFNAVLNKLTIEHQIKYSKLHEERAAIIKELYNALFDVEQSLEILTNVFKGPEWTKVGEEDKVALEKIKMLHNKFELNRYFLTEELCKKIEEIINECDQIRVDMYFTKYRGERKDISIKIGTYLSSDRIEDPVDKWLELNKKVLNEIKNSRLELVNNLRKLIGTE